MEMIKQPTIPPMPKQPTFDARDTQYNLPIGTDTISRKQAIEAVQNRHMMLSKEKVLLINDLEKLPSAQPEPSQVARDIARIVENEKDMRILPKRGRWIHDGSKWTNRWICSECGYKWFFDCIEGAFCPHCGAKMEVTDG